MVAHDADLRVWLATPDAAEHLDVGSLDAEDAARWQEIRTARRRRDWASSRALLAAVPAVTPCSRSLSHSHGFAALAMTHPALNVGVDVEVMTPRDFQRMAEVAFAADEAACLASLDPVARAERFYDLWTLKEAFAKALPLPFTEALTTCRFVDTAEGTIAAIPTSLPWRATLFAPRPNLRLAVARVARTVEQLAGRIHVQEWPTAAPSGWPVVLDLPGAAGTCTGVA